MTGWHAPWEWTRFLFSSRWHCAQACKDMLGLVLFYWHCYLFQWPRHEASWQERGQTFVFVTMAVITPMSLFWNLCNDDLGRRRLMSVAAMYESACLAWAALDQRISLGTTCVSKCVTSCHHRVVQSICVAALSKQDSYAIHEYRYVVNTQTCVHSEYVLAFN